MFSFNHIKAMYFVLLISCGAGVNNPENNQLSNNNILDAGIKEETSELNEEESASFNELLSKSNQLIADHDYENAEITLKNAIKINPKSFRSYYNLGVISERRGDYDNAEKYYLESINIKENYFLAVKSYSILLSKRSNQNKAFSFLNEKIEKYPDQIEFKNILNRIKLSSLKDNDVLINEIISDTKKVLKIDEKNVDAMIVLASAFYKQNKYELAFAILENAKALDDKNFEIFFKMANSKIKLEEHRLAQTILEESLNINSNGIASAEIHNTLGLLYHRTGNYNLAEEHFRHALAQWPDMIAAKINLGNTLKSQQKYVESMSVFKESYEKNQDKPELLYNIAILYLDGKIEELSSLDRLKLSIEYFNKFKQKTNIPDENVDSYIIEAQKRLEVEIKKAEQSRNQAKSVEEPRNSEDNDKSNDESGQDSEKNDKDLNSSKNDDESGQDSEKNDKDLNPSKDDDDNDNQDINNSKDNAQDDAQDDADAGLNSE
ncbi:tetratricopeptide repeat protein [Myxococcota bacterium]|nr:tetratricopeptide repeat protein [Myxococcota bacterium]